MCSKIEKRWRCVTATEAYFTDGLEWDRQTEGPGGRFRGPLFKFRERPSLPRPCSSRPSKQEMRFFLCGGLPFRSKSINFKHERESEKKHKEEEKKVASKYWIAFQAGRTDVKSLTSVIQSFFPTAEKNVDSLETPSDFLGTFSERQKLLAPLYWKKKGKIGPVWDHLGADYADIVR